MKAIPLCKIDHTLNTTTLNKPSFTLLKLLDFLPYDYGFILAAEILANPANEQLNLPFRSIDVESSTCVYIYDRTLTKRQISRLKRGRAIAIDRSAVDPEEALARIEASFDFEPLERTSSHGKIKLHGDTFQIEDLPEAERKDSIPCTIEMIHYRYTKSTPGIYSKSVALHHDLMDDDFYGALFPNCIGLEREFLSVVNHVKPEFRSYFKEHFLDRFEEGKTLFCWEY